MVNLTSKSSLILAGVVLVLLAGGLGWYRYRQEQQQRVVLELELAGQKQLNDSTVARLTTSLAARDSLRTLLDAAHQLHGTLVAGTSIHVPKRDTVVVHDTLITQMQGGMRTATFRDTTFACQLAGTVVAPPTGPLGITYQLTRPEFRPQVGFVEVGGRMVAVVSWGGEHVQVEAPYARPVPHTKLLQGFGAGWYDVSGKRVILQAGALLELPWGFEALAALEQRIGESSPHLLAGARKTF